MSKIIKGFFFFLIVVPIVCIGQTGTELIKFADDAFESQNYALAAVLYKRYITEQKSGKVEKVYAYELRGHTRPPKKTDADSVATAEVSAQDRKNAEIEFKLAESYRLNYQYENAERMYDTILDKYPGQIAIARYWYGISLMKNRKYQMAYQELEKFMEEYPDKESSFYISADANTFNCFFALDTNTTKKGVNVFVLDSSVNGGIANFGVNYFIDSSAIMFASARKGNTANSKDLGLSGFYTDIFIAEENDQGYSPPKRLDLPVNSVFNEVPGCITLDKKTIYFTRWSEVNKEECAIYMSKSINGQWLTPIRLNEQVNLPGFRSMHPALSGDESRLYFSSNRPGGLGKSDLWVVNLNDEGQPSRVRNLGSKVNTPENEVTPFFHQETQTLYFSSDGHLSFGGLDVFKAFKSDTLWSTPKNLGRPYNSGRDESYFILSKDQMHGFFSSDREKCAPCESSYCLQGYRFKLDTEPSHYTVSGYVYDKETNAILANALVSLMDVKGDIETFFVTTDEKGFYTASLREDMEFYMKAQKKKHFGDAGSVSTKGLTASRDFVHDFYLKPIPEGELVIPGIEYDYDKATLRPQSKTILDDLVEFLNLNDNIIIEISSHTDARGNDDYNQRLSQERAKSVVDYLISKGIETPRLMAQGYGETRLLITSANSEEDHQKNRRTAFRILSEDFQPVNKLNLRVK